AGSHTVTAGGRRFSQPTSTCSGSWQVLETPDLLGQDQLSGVSALSPEDVWAVGRMISPNGQKTRTLVEHWSGTAWSVVASPNPGTGLNELSDVAALAPDDIWAVGMFAPASRSE